MSCLGLPRRRNSDNWDYLEAATSAKATADFSTSLWNDKREKAKTIGLQLAQFFLEVGDVADLGVGFEVAAGVDGGLVCLEGFVFLAESRGFDRTL